MIVNDVHTHDHDRGGAIIDLAPELQPEEGKLYSVGVHPWDTSSPHLEELFKRVKEQATHPSVVAIGETGIDKLSGASTDIQTEILLRHIDLSERYNLPLILHVVRAFPEIIALKKRTNPRQPWIIHGFRGKPQLARELLRHGFYLSLGKKFNPDSAAIIPSDRLLIETDEDSSDPSEIAVRLPQYDPTLPDSLFIKGNRQHP